MVPQSSLTIDHLQTPLEIHMIDAGNAPLPHPNTALSLSATLTRRQTHRLDVQPACALLQSSTPSDSLSQTNSCP